MRLIAFLGIDSYGEFLQNVLIPWAPILLFAVIIYFMWRTLKLMPRTKPQEISPRSKSSITWDDVAGVDETKDELREVVDFLTDPKRFKRLGATVPKGILLHGPPGHRQDAAREGGRARVRRPVLQPVGVLVHRDVRRPRRRADPAPVQGGARERPGDRLHRRARRGRRPSRLGHLRRARPDAEPAAGRDGRLRRARQRRRHGRLEHAREARQGAAAARALRPPGLRAAAGHARPPGGSSSVHTRGKPLGQDIDLERVARHAAGLTGADLANLANEAAILAGRKKRDFIAQADFENAFERVIAGLQSRKVITDQEKRVVAWHEAGHALVSELLPTVDKVQKVSIVPRGKALGYTLNLPQEDRYLKSRQELIDYMKVLLAGRVSEQITFGRITTGASDDLSRVTAIARSMIHEYAMGTTIRSHQVPADDCTVSEALRQTRDEEVQAVAEEAYRGAEELLVDHRDLLDEIAERLLANEVIEREEIREILAAHRERRRAPAPRSVDARRRAPPAEALGAASRRPISARRGA